MILLLPIPLFYSPQVHSFLLYLDFTPENAKDCNQETLFGQHLLVCALQEMGSLMLSLGTTANNLIGDQSCSKHSTFFI